MAESKSPRGGKSYGWTATIYSAAERLVFGSQLVRARLLLLPMLRRATNVLLLGEGDGRFLAALVAQNPSANIVVVDRSQRMLRRAARRVPNGTHVRFVHADAYEFLANLHEAQPFDAIVTLFMLDCLTAAEVQAVVGEAAKNLSATGAWLWADFTIPSGGVFRPIARVMLRFLYWFFRATTDTSATTLVETTPYFEAVGLREVARASALFGMVESRYMRRVAQNVTQDCPSPGNAR